MKTLFTNAKVWLGKNYFAEAVGFDPTDGNIDFVGKTVEAEQKQSDYDEVIDLKNKLIMPAFTDGHCHLVNGALESDELNLRNAETKSDFVSIINEYKKKGTTWIYGGHFSETNFKEEIKLDKFFLDEICSDIPVLITRFDNHSGFANSKALELTGIESIKNEFIKGEIISDEHGGLTGELKEGAFYYVSDKIPHKTVQEKSALVLDEIKKLYSFGIVSVSDITQPEDLDVYEKLLNRDELKLKIYSILPFTEFENIEDHKKRFADFYSYIRFRCFKAYYDGALSSETALFWDNYIDKDHNGLNTDFVTSGNFKKIGVEIDKAGYQMAVHAIGDKAVSELLEFDKFLTEQNGLKKRRFRIEHAQHIRECDFKKFFDQKIIASVQPTHLYIDIKSAKEKLKNFQSTHNYKQLIDRSVKVCFGTDFPIVDENPFVTIYYAMTRKTDDTGEEFFSENKIDLVSCLEAYTINNAYAVFQDNVRGDIRIGKAADLIVLDDLFEMSPDEIRNAKVDMTYMNGERVY
ncbi:MAG: amidohydrolase [Ignavibacteria bacterium]|nr:amidohydrolase [Bacteroidota bacterium]MBL7127479.1 amidohydrolase [Ignavibacteria bacterium]